MKGEYLLTPPERNIMDEKEYEYEEQEKYEDEVHYSHPCPGCGKRIDNDREYCQDCQTTNCMRDLTIFDIITRFISGGF
jgi:hypothetical protein